MFFSSSGWFQNYLKFRLDNPFPYLAAYSEHEKKNKTREGFDTFLSQIAQKNGVMLGCPVNTEANYRWRECNFPKNYDTILFVYLDTLFSVAVQEYKILCPEITNESIVFKRVVESVISFYLRKEIRFKGEDLESLFDNRSALRKFRQLERELNKHIKVKRTMFTVSGKLQNLFGFLEIYYFLQWQFDCLTKKEAPIDMLLKILEEQTKMKERLIMIIAALIWADDKVVEIEALMMRHYIAQARLAANTIKKIHKKIRQYVHLDSLSFEVESLMLKRYLLETLILFSLIDNQQAVQEEKMIGTAAERLGIGVDELEILYMSVANFFMNHGHKFEFLKDNKAVSKLDNYVRSKVMIAVKSSLSNILTEIKETKELSELLMKSTSEPLTEEEKLKVREQLLDIAKTIPALAIFCLPAGGIVLTVLIKVLPFNILPSSFKEIP